MNRNLIKYLIATILASTLVNFALAHWPTTEEINEANKVTPSWFRQAELLLTKIKADSNLHEHIPQYQDEFEALNKEYNIEKHIFLVARNEYLYIDEVDIYREIEKYFSSTEPIPQLAIDSCYSFFRHVNYWWAGYKPFVLTLFAECSTIFT